MRAREQGEEAVAALQGGRDEARGGVGLVTAEARADEEPDGVDPSWAGGQISREGYVWDLAEKGPVQGEACSGWVRSVFRGSGQGEQTAPGLGMSHMLLYAASRGLG